ncbi:MAG: F0F1 ATP synthase subunit delta [Sulfurimonas sp.]|nr:F0F1 ATP synthase subunit delta [Sulfurimonas sp.]
MFNWWTFLFQIINFFVILYILYKLFFKPLKNIIQKRDESFKIRLKELEVREDELEQKEKSYQERLKEIDLLKEKELNSARKEAQQEKKELLQKANKEFEKERLKQKNIQEHEKEKINSTINQQSLQFSLDYISRFTASLIDEQMHKKLIEKFLYELKNDSEGDISILKKEIMSKECEIKLSTSLKIDEQTLNQIKETLENILKIKTVSLKILSDKALIGGIKLEIKNKIIDGSIQGVIKNLENEATKEL